MKIFLVIGLLFLSLPACGAELEGGDIEYEHRLEAAIVAVLNFNDESPEIVASNVVQAFMDSPPHRANMLRLETRDLGVGVAFAPTKIYVTMLWMKLLR